MARVSSRVSRLRPVLLATFVVLLPARAARAQSVSPRQDEPVCLGFSFGAWTPALDWRAAGHGEMPDARVLQHAPSGRDWASDAGAGMPDTLLMLYPGWWPAGVRVDLPTRTPAPGDTVVGRAIAFVANGSAQAPTARVRAWQVPCKR
jgi:hypothetical protein